MVASRFFPLVVLVIAGCANARADESSSNASSLAEPTKTFHCRLTSTEQGTTVVDEGTINLNTGTQWLRMSRSFTFGTQVTTGSTQGVAVFSSGSLNPHSFGAAGRVNTYLIGEIGLVTDLDGTNPRMLVPGGTFVPCTAD